MKKQYVYLLRAEGTNRYKIGMTTRPITHRLQELNSSQAPYPIALVEVVETDDARTLERRLHVRFSDNREYGEWFLFNILEVRAVRRAMMGDRNHSPFAWLIIGIALLILAIAIVNDTQPKHNGNHRNDTFRSK